VAIGKILIMDDEDLVRAVAGKMLEFLGYEAVTARSGEEAISLYQSHRTSGKPFDAVILDWMVPAGLDGFKTMERLRAMDAEAKGILSSGYPEQNAETRITAGFTDVIGKPYEIKTLRETLERVMGKAPASS
jgi:two-component system cell cycle sensor histidine kinase/response regulator CckA